MTLLGRDKVADIFQVFQSQHSTCSELLVIYESLRGCEYIHSLDSFPYTRQQYLPVTGIPSSGQQDWSMKNRPEILYAP